MEQSLLPVKMQGQLREHCPTRAQNVPWYSSFPWGQLSLADLMLQQALEPRLLAGERARECLLMSAGPRLFPSTPFGVLERTPAHSASLRVP